MFFFGNKKPKQDICLISETNTIIEDRLEAGTQQCQSVETAEAWELDSKQQCKDEQTGRYIQFIGTSHCTPIRIYQEIPEKQDTTLRLISSNTEDQEMTYLGEQNSRRSHALILSICAAMLTLTVCIIALIKVMG